MVAAVQELNRSQNVGATQLSCKSSKIWEHGTSLMNYLRMVRTSSGRREQKAGALIISKESFQILGNVVIGFLEINYSLDYT